MNPNNYATLEQAKKMKGLGYPQMNTDCIWIKSMINGEIDLWQADYCTHELNRTEWYAAPNASEIELKLSINNECLHAERKDGCDMFMDENEAHHAQVRASAWIWEKENK
jgi:hypothetical protein